MSQQNIPQLNRHVHRANIRGGGCSKFLGGAGGGGQCVILPKTVPRSEFLNASSPKRVPLSEFLKVSSSKRVPQSEFPEASSLKRVTRSELSKRVPGSKFPKASSPSEFPKQVPPSKFPKQVPLSEFPQARNYKHVVVYAKIPIRRWVVLVVGQTTSAITADFGSIESCFSMNNYLFELYILVH
jgi:hypothetical protein